MCHPKKLSFDAKREGSLLHVENNKELVWYNKGLVGGEVAWVSFPRLVFAGKNKVLLFRLLSFQVMFWLGVEWISSLNISRVWCWQDERWWTGVGWGSQRLVDRGRRGSKVVGEACWTGHF